MSYQVVLSDGATVLVTVPDNRILGPLELNSPSNSSLNFNGRGSVNYSLATASNFAWLLQNFAAPFAPVSPIAGQLWYNTSGHPELFLYNSTNHWVQVATSDSPFSFSGTGTFLNGIIVYGNSTFFSPVFMESTLSVQGNSTFVGPVLMESTLQVNGSSTFIGTVLMDNNLTVQGNISVGGSGTFVGSVLIEGNLAVDGNSTFVGQTLFESSSTFINPVLMESTLNVDGSSEFLSFTQFADSIGVTNNLFGNTAFFNNVSISYNTTLNTLNVLQYSSFQGSSTFNQAVQFNDGFTVGGDVIISNDMQVFGPVLLNSGGTFGGPVLMASTLQVNNNATFVNPVTLQNNLQVNGSETVNGTLTAGNIVVPIGGYLNPSFNFVAASGSDYASATQLNSQIALVQTGPGASGVKFNLAETPVGTITTVVSSPASNPFNIVVWADISTLFIFGFGYTIQILRSGPSTGQWLVTNFYNTAGF